MCKGGKKLRFGKVERYEPTLVCQGRLVAFRFPKAELLTSLTLLLSLAKWNAMSRHWQNHHIPNVFGSRFASGRTEKLEALEFIFSKNCREQRMWRKQFVGWKSLLGEIFGNWHIVQSCWFFTRSFHIFFCISKRPFRSKHSQYKSTRWWFQLCSFFTPTLGNDPIWRSYVLDGLKTPN